MAEKESFLIATDEYLKAGIHIGTKFRTKYMEPFIYKTRSDGLSVLNLQKIDERLRLVINLMSMYAPEEILVVSRRENGWKPIRALETYTGIKAIAGRYPPGILTNPNLKGFMEIKLIVATDAWPDRNAINDALKMGVPIIAFCDTNNQANNLDLVMPCNNKGKKSLGLIYWIIAKEYSKNRGLIKKESDFKATIEDFAEE